MTHATHDDVVRLFPGIQDHTVQEMLVAEPTVDELEAALLLMQDNDEGLTEFKQQKGDRLNHLLGILANSEIRPLDDLEP